MTNSKQISFAILGCGHIAHRHAKHLDNIEDAELRYCIDTDAERAQEFAQQFNITASDSFQEFLDIEVDVVIIATPNASHSELAINCVKAGKHVLVEKPLDISSVKAAVLIEEAKKCNKKVFVVKQNRYNPPVARLKELLEEGSLGKIHNVSIHCFWNRNEDYYLNSNWRGTKNLDGGTLFTQFSHFVDILYYLFGTVEDCSGYIQKCRDGEYLEFEDNASFSFRMKNGVIGSLAYSTTCFKQNMEGSLTLIAENASIKIGGKYLNSLEYISGLEDRFADLEKSRPANDYGYYEGSMSNHDKVLRNLIENLRGNEEIMTTGEDGLEVVKMIEQFYQSAVEKL